MQSLKKIVPKFIKKSSTKKNKLSIFSYDQQF